MHVPCCMQIGSTDIKEKFQTVFMCILLSACVMALSAIRLKLRVFAILLTTQAKTNVYSIFACHAAFTHILPCAHTVNDASDNYLGNHTLIAIWENLKTPKILQVLESPMYSSMIVTIGARTHGSNCCV